VLVLPSVMAMMGDNPMQSEFACHIGFRGKRFCRICNVVGKGEGDDNYNSYPAEIDDASSVSSTGSFSDSEGGRGAKRRKARETLGEMVDRVKKFMQVRRVAHPYIMSDLLKMQIGSLRTRFESMDTLRSQFAIATEIGGKTKYKQAKTDTGIKDTFQDFYAEQLLAATTRKGRTAQAKAEDVQRLLHSFPKNTMSPVWRIKGIYC
jgi:hypothetical protein